MAEIDTSAATPSSISISMGNDGPEVKQTQNDMVSFDTDDLDDEEVPGAKSDAGADDAGSEGDADEGDAEGDAEDLGEFDAEDPDVVAKFDSRYLTEAGTIDAQGSLSAEYFANVAKGVDGLNEATYAYLETKGVDRATVKQIEAMKATEAAAADKGVVAEDLKLMTAAGGAEPLAEAIKWGKEGGYDKAAQDRFNKVMKGKDFDAKQDAVDALMARFGKAQKAVKPTLPKRDATKGQGTPSPSVKGYKDRAEMRKAMSEIGDSRPKAEAHKRRLSVTKFPE
jgi:hypothetical protein